MTFIDWMKGCIGGAMFGVALYGMIVYLIGANYTSVGEILAAITGFAFAFCVLLKKDID